MTKKATKRALLSSALALVVCISMLIGTTYAWFTDSVTSTNNIIKSGNLDVELYYQVEGQTDWTKVEEGTNIFKENALWEPGHTEVVKLKVVNEGTLALKYNLGVNIASEVGSTNVFDKAFKLSEYIKYGIVAGAQTYTRDQAVAAVDATATALKSAWNSGTTKLLASEEAIVTMVVYMPETVGNEANYKKGFAIPTINLGINLFATQVEAEFDSFDNEYDKDAITLVKDAAEAQAALDNATSGAIIKLAPGVDYGTLYLRPVAGSANTVTDCDYLVYRNEMLRNVENLTIVGAEGATVDAIVTEAGYVKDSGSTGYVVNIKNLVIDSVNFTDDYKNPNTAHKYSAPLFFDISYINVDGLTVKNCSLIGDNDMMNFVYFYGSGNPSNSTFVTAAKNITITNNIVDGIARLCELRQTENVTITNNIIKNTTLHGMLLTVDQGTYTGNVTVTGNTATGINERFVRMAGAGDAVVVIKDNTINAYLGADDDYIKVTDGTNVTVENNPMTRAIKASTADELVNAFASLTAGDTLYITNDIDMTGKTIAPVTGNKGFTMIGNGYTISNLASTERALFVAHSGSSSYTFDGVVLENCSVDSVAGYGALFVGDGDTSDAITIKNCVVKNCTVKSTKYAAAFVAYTAGYNVQNNGPVYSDVLISNCKVSGGSITGGGSAGAAVGHSGGNPDTTTTIENLEVDGVVINGEDAEHTGVVVGTAHIGKTIINNVNYNNVTGNYNTTTVIYGRFVPGTTGTLTIDGVSK